MAQAPDVPDAPVPTDPDRVPATQGDLRTVRRWLLVTAVWALAATAVALIALLSADDTAEKESRSVGEQVTRLQRDVDRRLDALEEDVADAPQQADVANLAKRLSRLEQKSSKAADDAADAKSRVDDLETRVEELEATPDSGADTSPGNSDKQE
jgi:septal ring factor EnvC (AmiA/AmiB activator)